MDSTIVLLSYAPGRRRSRIRHAAMAFVALMTAGGAILGGFDLRRRVLTLERNSEIGPVDWSAVLSSWTLMETAWTLSSNTNPRRGGALDARRQDVDICMKVPLEYDAGVLR